MVGEMPLPDVIADDAGNPILHDALDPLRLVEESVGIDALDLHPALHQEIIELPKIDRADVGIVHRLVHDLVRMLHQRLEAREIARHQILDAGIDGKGVGRADVHPAARLEHPAQLLDEDPRIVEMLDALDAEHVVEMRIGIRQRIAHIVLLEAHALVLQVEGFGIDVEAMDVAVAAPEQFQGERAMAGRHVEYASRGRALEQFQHRRIVIVGRQGADGLGVEFAHGWASQ